METTKKSFLIYFDNYPILLTLPPEQRGWLLTALMAYGLQVGQPGEKSVEEVMDQFPQMTPDARVACSFMGASIRRDTQRWVMRRQRAEERRQQQPKGAAQIPDSEQRIAQDMERVRRLLEQK